MARPKKQTVDYFPHMATSGKTLFILESTFGNDGYAFWFKLLELLAKSEGHVFDTKTIAEWKFLVAITLVDEDKAMEILNMLAELNAIDADLWKNKIVWCQNLVDNVEDVYLKRRAKKPTRPQTNNNCDGNPNSSVVSVTETPAEVKVPIVSDSGNPQSKVKETKVNKTKVNNNNRDDDVVSSGPNAHEFYQQNFGVENSITSQNIEFWIDDLNEELVIEAMSRAALDQKGYKYAEGILKNWDKKNIKTIDEVKSADVAFENSKIKPSYGNSSARKETLPDWAKEENQQKQETPMSEEEKAEFMERLEKIQSFGKD